MQFIEYCTKVRNRIVIWVQSGFKCMVCLHNRVANEIYASLPLHCIIRVSFKLEERSQLNIWSTVFAEYVSLLYYDKVEKSKLNHKSDNISNEVFFFPF